MEAIVLFISISDVCAQKPVSDWSKLQYKTTWNDGTDLEESSLELLQLLRHSLLGDTVVQPVDTDVFLTGRLLRLDQPRGPVYADHQAARHLGVQGPAVTSFLHPEDPLDPGHHLVRAGVGRLVEVDEARLDVVLNVSLERRCSMRERSVVVGSDVQFIEVLQKQRPVRGVQFGRRLL